MKPYGRSGFVSGSSTWKVDRHLHDKKHRKLGMWWEGYDHCVSRRTMKLQMMAEIEQTEFL